MAHIVILGAGLGGIPMALEMRAHARKEDRVTVINKSDDYTFVPSNPWLAVGWRKPEQIIVPLAGVFKKRGIDFVAKAAEKVLPDANQVRLQDGSVVDYDFLVIATGPAIAFDDVPGLGPEAGFTQSICLTEHAQSAHAAWQQFVQAPGPIVAGAAQGASCFGPGYEFCMIMNTELKRRKIRDKVPMTFVTSEPYIGHLGLGGVGDTKGLLESVFREKDIKWICNARIEGIERESIRVEELDDNSQVRKKHTLPHAYSMLMPPFRGVSAVMGIDGLANPRGFVIADKHQCNPKYPNIFAIGVCVAVPQIPPRNVSWSSRGVHIHLGKIAFEKYFLHKVRTGTSEPSYEKYILKILGIEKIKGEKI